MHLTVRAVLLLSTGYIVHMCTGCACQLIIKENDDDHDDDDESYQSLELVTLTVTPYSPISEQHTYQPPNTHWLALVAGYCWSQPTSPLPGHVRNDSSEFRVADFGDV